MQEFNFFYNGCTNKFRTDAHFCRRRAKSLKKDAPHLLVPDTDSVF